MAKLLYLMNVQPGPGTAAPSPLGDVDRDSDLLWASVSRLAKGKQINEHQSSEMASCGKEM